MKRFIRTNNGKIIDTKLTKRIYVGEEIKEVFVQGDIFVRDILKQADTIEELIMVGDLVFDDEEDSSFCFIVNRIYEEYGVICFEGEFECSRYADMISKLYTKQGSNYILVTRKENGEWRVL